MPGAGRWLKNHPPRSEAGAGTWDHVYPGAVRGRAGTVIFRQPPAISGSQFPATGPGPAAGDRSGQPEYGSKLAGHGIYPVEVKAARRMGAIVSMSAPGLPWKAVR